MAVSMVEEGLIDRLTAIRRVKPSQLDQLQHPMVDPAAEEALAEWCRIARVLHDLRGARIGQMGHTLHPQDHQALIPRAAALHIPLHVDRGLDRHRLFKRFVPISLHAAG